jgi:hypothetical protein
MKRISAVTVVTILSVFFVFSPCAIAETYQVSWSPVTTYTDGTSIPGATTVSYNLYWTTDNSLSQSSLHSIASTTQNTNASFDPSTAGMTRGQTVYFTARTLLGTGEQSSLSTATPWVVPSNKAPGVATNMRIIQLN